MDDSKLEQHLRDMYSGDAKKLASVVRSTGADDMVQEWPQSGERIRGKENVLAIAEQYGGSTGTTPRMELRRITRPGTTWVVEGTIDYGDGTPVSAVSVIETDGHGTVTRTTDYFANPFEAPEWRRRWVEQMEPVGAR